MSDVVYLSARSLNEALTVLHERSPAATIIAGGQDIVPLMNQGRLAPSSLLDVSRLTELAAITDDHVLSIGALVTHAAIERNPLVHRRAPLLSEAAAQIGGGIQVRNRGTIGGTVAAANPAFDLPACLVALDAVCILRSVQGGRRVPAAAFFTGAGRTARRPDELLVAIEVSPPRPRTGFAYAKLKFTDGGYTIAGAACVLTMTADGVCQTASVVLSGVTEAPLALPTVASRLIGTRLTNETVDGAAVLTSTAVKAPITDVMADGDYRRAMAGVIAVQAVARAAARVQRGDDE